MAVSSPAVTSSPRDLRDLAHRLSYSVGPLVEAMHGGGAHGGAVARDDGATLVEAMAVECCGGDGVARRELVPSTAMAAPGAEAAGAANGEGGARKGK